MKYYLKRVENSGWLSFQKCENMIKCLRKEYLCLYPYVQVGLIRQSLRRPDAPCFGNPGGWVRAAVPP